MSSSTCRGGLCSSTNAMMVGLSISKPEGTVRPCYLLALPVELVNLILDNFVPNISSPDQLPATLTSDQKTLARICQLNNYSKKLAEPFLYRTYTKPTNLWTPESCRPNYNLRSFVQTIHKRAELRNHVRHIYLGEWETEASLLDSCVDIQVLYPFHDQKWVKMLGAALTRVVLRSRSNVEWTKSFCAGMEDAELALLLLYSPRLESLTINLPKMKYRPREVSYLESFVETLAQSPKYHGFARLERVNFFNPQREVMGNVTAPRVGIRQGIQYAFLQLPALTTYHAEGDQPQKTILSATPSALEDLQPCSTAVRHIVLKQCDLPISDISKLIESCRVLETFELGMGCQERHLRDDHLTWPQVLTALEPAKPTLRELTLGSTRRCWLEVGTYFPNAVLSWRALGSLQQFAAIRTLTIDQTTLLGLHTHDNLRRADDPAYTPPPLTDLLPPSLETLTVRDATRQTIKALSLLATQLRTSGARARHRMLRTIALTPLSDGNLALLRLGLGPVGAAVPSAEQMEHLRRGFRAVERSLLRVGVRLVVALLSESESDMQDPGICVDGRVAAVNRLCVI